MDKRIYLRVKLKSLAAEARIIRAEERRAKGFWKRGLMDHRKGTVRYEARLTLWAYAFIRGKELRDVEPKTKTIPTHIFVADYGKYKETWEKVRQMVATYGLIPEIREGESQFDFEARKRAEKEDEMKRFGEWKARALA